MVLVLIFEWETWGLGRKYQLGGWDCDDAAKETLKILKQEGYSAHLLAEGGHVWVVVESPNDRWVAIETTADTTERLGKVVWDDYHYSGTLYMTANAFEKVYSQTTKLI